MAVYLTFLKRRLEFGMGAYNQVAAPSFTRALHTHGSRSRLCWLPHSS